MIKQLFNGLRSWFVGLFGNSNVYKSVWVEDIPVELQPYKVYIAGTKDSPWLAAMLCPCGCGSTLHMNLLSTHKPCWKINVASDSTVSFRPSLWKKTECRSHFFLKKGSVKWV